MLCSASTATTPVTRDQLLPPLAVLIVADLEDAIRQSVQAISYDTPEHPARPGGWPIGWGTEIDIRVITLAGTGDVTDLAVASYLAKYSSPKLDTDRLWTADETADYLRIPKATPASCAEPSGMDTFARRRA